MKKNMILADLDSDYLNHIAGYFMEHAPQIELNLFTKPERLQAYLESGGMIDILVVSEEMMPAIPEKVNEKTVKLLLSSSMTPAEGYALVKKYQKTQSLLNDILLQYAEQSGSTEAIRGKSNTRIAAFYSPAGGSGKTVLALGFATSMVKEGKKVFYLNLETIDSVNEVLSPTQGTLSDLFLAVRSKGMDAGLKLAACAGTDAESGFSYVSGLESSAEYSELKREDIEKLLKAIRDLAEYDEVVVDLSSGFSEIETAALNAADVIYVPQVSGETAIAKMKHFLREAEIQESWHALEQKMKLVANRTPVSGISREVLNSGILERVPCICAVAESSLFSSLKQVMRSGDALRSIMAPLMKREDSQ